jgi:hypothetical protein
MIVGTGTGGNISNANVITANTISLSGGSGGNISNANVITANTVTLSTVLKLANYANATARDAAITSPTVGMIVYLVDTGNVSVYFNAGSPTWGNLAPQ